MTTTTQELTTTVTHTIAAPAARVFDAWLDPALLLKFMTPAPTGTVAKAETEAKVGGRFDIVMAIGDKEIPHWGTYKTIDRPNQLVFTWESPFSVEDSTVTLDFAETGDGTQVTLTHVRFPSEESRDNHNAGWTRILECLGIALAA